MVWPPKIAHLSKLPFYKMNQKLQLHWVKYWYESHPLYRLGFLSRVEKIWDITNLKNSVDRGIIPQCIFCSEITIWRLSHKQFSHLWRWFCYKFKIFLMSPKQRQHIPRTPCVGWDNTPGDCGLQQFQPLC